MIDKNSDCIQAIQQILEKTHKGRNIRRQALAAVASWKDNVETEYGKSECQLCGLILKSNYFLHGCLNCGSTDVKSVSNKEINNA